VSGLALFLVLSGAALHAAWSIAAKFGSRAKDPIGFTWASSLISAVLLAPFAIWAANGVTVHWPGVLLGAVVAGSIQTVYFMFVQGGYAIGDVSVLYPMSRGLGPALTMVGAMLLFGERPHVVSLIGGAIVIAGIVLIGVVGGRGGSVTPLVVCVGVATGVLIASYTLWDTFAMRELKSLPLLHVWIVAMLQCALLTPWMVLRKRAATAPFRESLRPLLVAAPATTLSYLAIVSALALAPVALVAPLREVSVVLVALAGWLIFKESNPVSRILGAIVVVIGGTLVAIG